MTVSEVLQDIDLAFRQLEFSIRLLSYCGLGKLKPEEFDDDHFVQLQDGDLHFPAGTFAKAEAIHDCASIGVLIAAGVTALVLNRGFDEIGMAPDPASNDALVRLRTFVYMVRNAYAHDIAAPRWEVRGQFLRQLTVDLNGGNLTVDLTALHGTPFSMEQIAGYSGWYRVRSAVVARLEALK